MVPQRRRTRDHRYGRQGGVTGRSVPATDPSLPSHGTAPTGSLSQNGKHRPGHTTRDRSVPGTHRPLPTSCGGRGRGAPRLWRTTSGRTATGRAQGRRSSPRSRCPGGPADDAAPVQARRRRLSADAEAARAEAAALEGLLPPDPAPPRPGWNAPPRRALDSGAGRGVRRL